METQFSLGTGFYSKRQHPGDFFCNSNYTASWISVLSTDLWVQRCPEILLLLIAFIHLSFQLVIAFKSGLKNYFAYNTSKESNIYSFFPPLASHLAILEDTAFSNILLASLGQWLFLISRIIVAFSFSGTQHYSSDWAFDPKNQFFACQPRAQFGTSVKEVMRMALSNVVRCCMVTTPRVKQKCHAADVAVEGAVSALAVQQLLGWELLQALQPHFSTTQHGH